MEHGSGGTIWAVRLLRTAQQTTDLPAILPNLELPWGDRVMASDENSPTPPPQNRKLIK